MGGEPDPTEQVLVHLYAAHLLRAALKLGLPDAVGERGATAAELAARTGSDPAALARLLAALAAIGVFAGTGDGRYVHTPVSGRLRGDDEIGQLITHDATVDGLWQAWSCLGDAVRTGESPFPRLHGTDFYSYLRDHDPEQAERFHDAMSSATETDNESIVAALDLASAGTLVDVGGGRGGLLRDLLRHNPALRGVLLDTEPVVADALAELRAGELADRCELVAGDARAAVPQGADVYLLRFVLHNWDDGSCVRMLRRCAEAAAPGARIVVAELPLGDGTPDPATAMMDMGMLVMFGSRERTEAEYAALLERAGLRHTGTTALASLHLIEARACEEKTTAA